MQKFMVGACCIVANVIPLTTQSAFAANAVFQNFFFDACVNPVGELATRCGETPGGTGDLSGNSESSLNPSQALSSQAAAMGRAREKTKKASNAVAQIRDMDADKQQAGLAEAGGLAIGPFSLLLNGRYTWFDQDRDRDDRERGYDGDIWGAELGFDYRVSDQTVVGGFLGYENTDADYDKDEAGVNFTPQSDSGTIDGDSYSITLFGSHNFSEQLFVEGSAGYSYTDYTFERNVVFQESTRTVAQTNVRAKGDTDGHQYWGSAGIGYDFYRDALTVTPYARATYVRSTIDNYTEKDPTNSGLQMRVNVDSRTSVTTDLGVSASYAKSTGWGVLVPHVRAEWEHEFEDDAQDTSSFYQLDANRNLYDLEGESPDTDYFNLGAGVSAIFPNGWMGFVDYEGLVGYEELSKHRLTVGLRVEL